MHDAEMGTEFLEFPPILQIHLRRFEFNYRDNRLLKINNCFEFPQTIYLGEFLSADAERPNSTVFDLYGVLVRSGSAYSGHYYAFLRTSTASDWHKFNDTSVTMAAVQEAVDDNFSSSASWANGYMLVYVRQADAPQIYQRIDDSLIHQHLRDYAGQGEESSSTGSVEISVADESCIRQNCASGKTGFECKPLHKTATFSRDRDTNASVYQKFTDIFEIPVDEMRLWNAHTLFAPYTVFENTTTSVSRCFYKHSSSRGNGQPRSLH
jgi:ubiquitin carboxyl-terminal hydrolase 7